MLNFCHNFCIRPCAVCMCHILYTYLHSQAHGVEHNKEEHKVLKVAGSDDVPHLILVGIFGNITSQWTGLKSILHTLALKEIKRRKEDANVFAGFRQCQNDKSGCKNKAYHIISSVEHSNKQSRSNTSLCCSEHTEDLSLTFSNITFFISITCLKNSWPHLTRFWHCCADKILQLLHC